MRPTPSGSTRRGGRQGKRISVHEKRKQGSMLPEGVQHGHEGIALLTPFTLMDHVVAAVGPEVLRWVRVELEHEWERCVPTDMVKSIQHRTSRGVESVAVNGELRERLKGMRHAFPASVAEAYWTALQAKSVRRCSSSPVSERDPHTPSPQTTARLLGDFRTSSEERCCLKFRLQDQPQVFGGRPRWATRISPPGTLLLRQTRRCPARTVPTLTMSGGMGPGEVGGVSVDPEVQSEFHGSLAPQLLPPTPDGLQRVRPYG